VILSELAKDSVTRSVAWSLCDSWAFCIDPLQNFYERSPAEQYSLSSANVEAVSEFEPVLSSGPDLLEWERLSSVSGDSRGNCELPLSKSYMVYRTAPFSTTLNDCEPRFQGHEYIRNS